MPAPNTAFRDIDRFSPENVCKVLLEQGLLSESQKKEIMAKKDRLLNKLEQLRAMKQSASASKSRLRNPVTIIDVIVSLQVERADDSSKVLDEETIYQALAKSWKLPYKK
ncbi:MAG: hypothetical protein FJY85_21475, partial [Deltaproteobacteria bacterium]|nr:hypothetical protein [Deltaproteobacteria bacterium]